MTCPFIPVCPCASQTGEPSTDHSIPEVSHQGCVERKDQLPQPAGSTSNAAQEPAAFLHSKGALLAHVQLGVHQDP